MIFGAIRNIKFKPVKASKQLLYNIIIFILTITIQIMSLNCHIGMNLDQNLLSF